MAASQTWCWHPVNFGSIIGNHYQAGTELWEKQKGYHQDSTLRCHPIKQKKGP